MRSIALGTVIATAFCTPVQGGDDFFDDICRANVQHLTQNITTEKINSAPKFGEYGYNHRQLHQFGTIDELMQKTGKRCCDGGEGGECRETVFRWQSPTSYFKHGDRWCPIETETIRLDIKLPPGVEGVVCANAYVINGCPNGNYCAAGYIGG